MGSLIVSQSDGVLYVKLNRPDVRNAFDDKLIGELTGAFQKVDARTVILSGEGKAFCAGGDLGWMRRSIDYTEAENLADAANLAAMFKAIDECPCPVIALVHGAAFGGGVGLVSVADIVLAAEGTKFCFSEVKLGLAPAVIAQYSLRKIGMASARRYFLTAEIIEADEAKRIGLAHEVLPQDQLGARANEIIAAIKATGANAVREAKQLIREITENPSNAERLSTDLIAKLRVSPEGQEGVRAFLEKRPPSW